MDGSVFVSDPLVWDASLLTRANDGNGFAIDEGLVVARNQYPAGMQSSTPSDFIAYLFEQTKLLVAQASRGKSSRCFAYLLFPHLTPDH